MINRGTANKKFTAHVPCKECGSNDNVALYEDGHGYCFGCKKYFTKFEMEDLHKKYGPKPNGKSFTKKKQINENNYTYTKGKKHEVPWSLEFDGTTAGQKRKEYKLKKGYDAHYIYTDKEGNTAFVIERQYTDESKQEKKFISHSKWKNKIDGSTRWQSKHMASTGRTIYNLEGLSKARESTVVVVEGEKAADAYIKQRLLPCTTWSNGAGSVLKNDWKPLLDFQTIVLFPDNDDEGFTAMHKLAEHLVNDINIARSNIRLVTYPDGFPEKWDLADPVPENIDTDGHRLAFGAQPYTEVIPNYEDVWEKFKTSDVSEKDKNKADRLLELSQDIIYISELDEMLDMQKDILSPLKSFDNNYAYLKVDKKKPSTWLLEQEPEIFKRANSFEYNPKRPRGLNDVAGVPIANRYRGPSIIAKSGDVTMWKDTLVDLFDDEKAAHAAEQYFAYCFQNQGEKTMWCPLWISPKKGIGKNWITNLLGKIYGIRNFRPNLKYKHVIGKFNSWIIGAQFAVINEVFLSKNFNKKQELSEEIKDLITEPFAHIEEKFRRGFDYPNTCNFILISNHEDCMNVADDERRYYVKKLTDRVRRRDYWKPRWEWSESDGARFLMQHLKELKIDDPDLYKERAPITDDMMELARMSEHPIFKWLDEHRAAETGPFKRNGSSDYRVFNYMVVATDLHRVCHAFKQEGALEVVIDWCKKRSTSWDPIKLVSTKQIVCNDGTRPRAYLLPPLEPETANEYWLKELRSKGPSDLGKIFDMKGSYKEKY